MNKPSQHLPVSRSAEKSHMPTTNTTNSSMNTITDDTNAGIAPASNGSSSRTRIRTVIPAAGTPLCVQPSDGGTYSVADGSFSIGDRPRHHR